jgi:CheY-like chemotaxis protein/anti-sigma regulatory factor (Ser/Thr protein kinase)
MQQASILVVDDEPINHSVIEAILDNQGYALHFASSGLEALERLSSVEPDLILMDVMMPGISGIETCRRIKSNPQWQAIPIVMITSLSSTENLSLCIAAGADEFLSKPANPTELLARVQAMLRIKGQYDNIKTLSHLQANTIEVLQDSLNMLRRNLVASLPHELNTPLNGIHGVIELLLDPDNGMDAEETRQFLELAEKSVLRLEKSIQRFLLYFEMEMSPHRVNRGYIRVYPILESCAWKQADIAKRRGDLTIGAEDHAALAAQEDLSFIIEELLENAFKFSKPGTPVTISLHRIDNKLQLSVCDQGRGMTQEQITNIGAFMQFERKKYEQQGSGLGLAIVNKMTVALGGSLSIESVYQQGTRINITLPGLG